MFVSERVPWERRRLVGSGGPVRKDRIPAELLRREVFGGKALDEVVESGHLLFLGILLDLLEVGHGGCFEDLFANIDGGAVAHRQGYGIRRTTVELYPRSTTASEDEPCVKGGAAYVDDVDFRDDGIECLDCAREEVVREGTVVFAVPVDALADRRGLNGANPYGEVRLGTTTVSRSENDERWHLKAPDHYGLYLHANQVRQPFVRVYGMIPA